MGWGKALLGALLAGIAALLATIGLLVASSAFRGGYQEAPYLPIGVDFLGVAVLAAVAARLLLSRR